MRTRSREAITGPGAITGHRAIRAPARGRPGRARPPRAPAPRRPPARGTSSRRPSRMRDRSSSASTSPASRRTCRSSDVHPLPRPGPGAPMRSTTRCEHLELHVERGDRGAQLVGGDGEELVAGPDLLLRLPVEERLGLDAPPLGGVADRRPPPRWSPPERSGDRLISAGNSLPSLRSAARSVPSPMGRGARGLVVAAREAPGGRSGGGPAGAPPPPARPAPPAPSRRGSPPWRSRRR